jgi:hypothetical protein
MNFPKARILVFEPPAIVGGGGWFRVVHYVWKARRPANNGRGAEFFMLVRQSILLSIRVHTLSTIWS